MSKPSAPKTIVARRIGIAIVAVAAFAVVVVGAPASRGRRANFTQKPIQAASVPAAAHTMESRGRVRATLNALPLGFEANQGQSDPQVKYLARGDGYTLFLTQNDAVFAVDSFSPADGAASSSRASSMHAHAPAHGQEKSAAIHMHFLGAKSRPELAAGTPLPGIINYYLGNDPEKWQQGVKQYSAVTYREVYPGVNLTFHGKQRQVEFDFIVSPGASSAPVRVGFSGARKIATDASGNLVLSSTAGDVLLHKPVAYQDKNGQRQLVDVGFQPEGNNEVAFALGAYDHSRELVIDPTLTYATYLGGNSEDEVFGIAVDGSNNVYVTGESKSKVNFPPPFTGTPTGFGFYVLVAKLDSQGALKYLTFAGGAKVSGSTNNDSGLAIATDSAGEAYVTGHTESTNFPTTPTGPQPTSGGGGNCTNSKRNAQPCSDAFALKLNSSGALAWSTYIGGTNDDDGFAIALDGAGNVWVAGDTFSSSFYPNTVANNVLYTNFNHGGTLTPPPNDGFVVEIASAGTAPFLFSTYLGGTQDDQINGIAIDKSNNVYVAGETNSSDFPSSAGSYQSTCGSDTKCNATGTGAIYTDAFVTKINAGGTSVDYSTYVGGSSDDYAFAIAVDSAGDAYITGETTNDDTTTSPAVAYPTTSGAFSTTYNSAATSNAFVTELNPTGSSLVYSTFLGGSTQDFGGGIAVDKFNNAYVTGPTLSTDFPITANAFQTKLNTTGQSGHSDAFVTQVYAGGEFLGYSSFLGASGDEDAAQSGAVGVIALDSSDNVWVGGSTNSAHFPTTAGAAKPAFAGDPYDGFVAEVSSNVTPDFAVAATVLSPSSVTQGGSSTSSVTVAAFNGYTGTVDLTCKVTGLGSPLPTCSLSPASGNSSTLTVKTTGAAAAVSRTSNILYASLLLPVVGLSLVGMRFNTADSRRRKLLGFLLLGVVVGLLFFLPACSSSSTTTGGGGGCSGCTPFGSYTVVVTGTDHANSSLTHDASPPLGLVVN